MIPVLVYFIFQAVFTIATALSLSPAVIPIVIFSLVFGILCIREIFQGREEINRYKDTLQKQSETIIRLEEEKLQKFGKSVGSFSYTTLPTSIPFYGTYAPATTSPVQYEEQ